MTMSYIDSQYGLVPANLYLNKILPKKKQFRVNCGRRRDKDEQMSEPGSEGGILSAFH